MTGAALADVSEVVERMPAWAGREVRLEVLKGGLSHLIYRAEVDGERAVIRILNPTINEVLLGVPAHYEVENTICAAEAGVGPAVRAAFPELPALVLELIDGPTYGDEDVRRDIPGVARACRDLHERARPFANDFSIFRHLEGFLALCARHDLRVPDGFLDAQPTVRRIEETLAVRAGAPVPCHNDLLAENFMHDGERVRIVDYQLSGNHDRCFELGDVAAEAVFDPDQVERLCEAYFRERLPVQVARTRLYAIVSDVTWTLWFSIHDALVPKSSVVDFDYVEESNDKWGRALAALDSPELGGLLEQARAG